ncbi:hypothetical protein [Desulforhabdus sp. TSK]|uniref:hypothetical protein n=1 Tax=Desulforhabdus sp. TSK TaxID=2925014 RepID=UPI001FC8CF2B|nr:hypothetical protein [Desulforhabdus sp. TSK]GKT07006.1 hypothetical protein DSTSK_03110 [Desulforhabdus sp. TSK]
MPAFASLTKWKWAPLSVELCGGSIKLWEKVEPVAVKVLEDPLMRIDTEELTDNFHRDHFRITQCRLRSPATESFTLRDGLEVIIYTTVPSMIDFFMDSVASPSFLDLSKKRLITSPRERKGLLSKVAHGVN